MTATDTKVDLIRRDKKSITVRLPDGTERRIAGENVTLVYCRESHLDDCLNKVADPEVSLDLTLTDSGLVLVFGTTNWI